MWRSKLKDLKRALRRHHVVRLKKARRWYHGTDQWQNPKWIGKAVHTPQLCSCWMCGNQRKIDGPTVQETRWELSEAEDGCIGV